MNGFADCAVEFIRNATKSKFIKTGRQPTDISGHLKRFTSGKYHWSRFFIVNFSMPSFQFFRTIQHITVEFSLTFTPPTLYIAGVVQYTSLILLHFLVLWNGKSKKVGSRKNFKRTNTTNAMSCTSKLQHP